MRAWWWEKMHTWQQPHVAARARFQHALLPSSPQRRLSEEAAKKIADHYAQGHLMDTYSAVLRRVVAKRGSELAARIKPRRRAPPTLGHTSALARHAASRERALTVRAGRRSAPRPSVSWAAREQSEPEQRRAIATKQQQSHE